MQHVQEGSICVTRHLSNLGFINQRLIKLVCSIGFFSVFLLIVCSTVRIFSLLFLRDSARNVKAHFHKLISSGCSFSASIPGTALFMSIHSVRSWLGT